MTAGAVDELDLSLRNPPEPCPTKTQLGGDTRLETEYARATTRFREINQGERQ